MEREPARREADARPDAARRRSRRSLGALLVVVLLVVVSGTWVAERRLHAAEGAAMASCDGAARSATRRAEAGLARVRALVSPAVYRSPPANGPALFGLVAARADAVRGPVVRALRRCEAVEVVGWHPGTRAERDNVLAFLAAYDRWLVEVAGDGEAIDAEPAALGGLRRRAFPTP